jgi:putative addiction module killer protein
MYRIGYESPVYSIQTTETFDVWFEALKDRRARARIQARIDRAEDGNFGDCRPIGDGVSEMRIHHGPGYRVYFKRNRSEAVILLAGGDKSTQASDIRLALQLASRLGK